MSYVRCLRGLASGKVLRIVRDSGVAVSEADTAAELQHVWRDKRWWISPEGTACLAAIPQWLDRGLVRPGERVVAVNTGSAEKYLPALRHLL